jgi:hypothetical protein
MTEPLALIRAKEDKLNHSPVERLKDNLVMGVVLTVKFAIVIFQNVFKGRMKEIKSYRCFGFISQID